LAIVRMKRMFLAALKKDRDDLLNELIKLSCVEISSPEEGIYGEEMLKLLSQGEKAQSLLEADVKKLGSAIEALERFDKSKRPLFAKLRKVAFEEAKRAIEASESVSERIAFRINNLNNLKNEENRLLANIEALKPYEALDVDLTTGSTEKTKLIIGTIDPHWTGLTIEEAINAAGVELVLEMLNSEDDVIKDKNQVKYVFGIYPKDREEECISFLKTLGFQKSVFRDIKAGTAKENIDLFNSRLEEISMERKEQEDALTEMVHELPDLKAAYDMLFIELQKEKKSERLLCSSDVFFAECWVPAEKEKNIIKLLSGYDLCFEIRDPVEGETPPVLLKNSSLVAPFGTVTELYSLPAYGSIDPNPFIAVFYFIFFGMMLGDAAFGAILTAVCFGVVFGLKPKGESLNKLLSMLGICGISTMIWGILTGSYFGDVISVVAKTFFGVEIGDLSILLNPLNEPMTILVICLAIGLVHIFVGMALNAYLLIKKGQVWAAIFDVGFWYLLIIGLLLWYLAGDVGMYMAAIGAAGLVLTQGRSKKNPIMKLLSGIISLYGITGYLADVLSYSRILALGLSSGVMASVFNTIGTLMGNNFIGVIMFIVIFIIGSVFNLALSGLGAFVHSLRLNYVEFFSKFYESGGRAFDPFRRKTKYIQIIDRGAI
jgi:V/A-type H+-transporting ATPase subunit I